MRPLAMGVFAAVVLTACSGPVPDPSTSSLPAPAIGAVSTGIATVGQITRPIDAYMLPADQIVASEGTRLRTADACMSDRGYQSADVRADTDLAPAIAAGVRDRVVRSDLYGFFDSLDAARRYGYQAPAGSAGSYGVTWSPDVPQDVVDACFAQAAAAAGAENSLDLTTTQGLPDGGPTVPSGDPTYVAAVADWSGCMTERGYTYTDPQAALGDPRWSQDRASDQASAAQIATAVADVECKISTNLIGVAVAVQSAYDQQYIQSHADQLSAYRTHLLAVVAGTAGQ